jgi:DNA-3-methyladenine glycosylase II
MRPDHSFRIKPKGPFSLYEAAMFGFGQRHDVAFDGTMRLAFAVDGYRAQAAVALTQDDAGTVHGTIAGVRGAANRTAIIAQTARVLSLDHDATGYVEVGARDPVIARLLKAAPGLRPPLFYSPYEAAAWAVISARRPARAANGWRDKLSAAIGAHFEVADKPMAAFPLPEAILEYGTRDVMRMTGMDLTRVERLMAVAESARSGILDAKRLAKLKPDDARTLLRTIPGIGPFYADLILLRATGVTDLLPDNEPHLMAIVGDLYGLGGPAIPLSLATIASTWAPWRIWVAVLARVAGPRVLTAGR